MFEKQNIKLKQLAKTARELLEYFPDQRVFALYGNMGAGKTTFIQAICHALGSADLITSPTFSIIHEYSNHQGYLIYHFDFYRIKNLEEAFDLGYEDYLYSGEYCLIEWPEKIEALLPDVYVEVNMEITGNEVRTIRAKRVG